MGQIISLIAVILFAAPAIGKFVTTFKSINLLASGMLLDWQAEYQLRLCGQIAATEANIRDAARLYLAETSADPAVLSAAVATAMEKTQIAFGRTSLPAVEGECRHQHFPNIHVRIHYQRNPTLPASWPNAIFRFVR